MLQQEGSSQGYPPAYPAYPGATSGATDPGSSLGLDRAARALLRRWWYPVLGGAALFALAWHYVPEPTLRYRAQAVLRLDDARQAMTGGLAGGAAENVRTPEFMISQVHVVRSQAVVGAVVDSLKLRVRAAPELSAFITYIEVDDSAHMGSILLRFRGTGYVAEAGGQIVEAAYGLPTEVAGVRFTMVRRPPVDSAGIEVLTRESAILQVTSALSAAPRDRTSIIDISFIDADPDAAQAIVNGVAHAYRAHNVAGVREAARRRRAFIESQWQAAEGRHDGAQQRLNQFRSSSRSTGVGDRLRQEQASVLALDAEHQTLDVQRKSIVRFIERAALVGDSAIYDELQTLVLAPGSAAGQLLSDVYNQINLQYQERDRLLGTGLTPIHPQVERVHRQIASIRAGVPAAARAQLASIDLRLGALQEQRDRSAATLQTLADPQADEDALLQEVAAGRSLADALRAEYHRASIEEAVDAGQAEILAFANAALPLPAGRRAQKLAIALFLGVMLGSVATLTLEVTNGSIRWRAELEALAPVPALAVIPRLSNSRRTLGAMLRRTPRAIAPPRGSQESSFMPAANFHTVGAEAYRVLRTNLSFLRRDGGMQTIVITSPQSGEGKSTTAANLAVSLARQELDVLLIDCDLRRPSQHRIFKAQEGPGFSEVLTGAVDWTEAIRVTETAGLYLLPRGSFSEAAAESLGGARMAELLEKMRAEYDVIIIDTPPALVAADATAVAAAADGVILVVRAGRTSRAAARLALRQLQAVGAHMIGFVLNDPDTIAGKYGEYTYSESYYSVQT